MNKLYMVWSDDVGSFYLPDGRGFTRALATAGRFTRADGETICRIANQDIPDDQPPRTVLLLPPELVPVPEGVPAND